MESIGRSLLRRSRRPLAMCLAAMLGLEPSLVGAALPNRGRGPALNAGTSDAFHQWGRNAVRADGAAAPATRFPVTNCNDTGSGSLRDAAMRVDEGGVLDLTTLDCSTITLTSGAIPLVVDNVSIAGPVFDKLAIVGNGSDRVFEHTGSGRLFVSYVGLSGGVAYNQNGGCIYSTGNVYLVSSVVSGCQARGTNAVVIGGGIAAHGYVKLIRSVVTSNRAESTQANAYAGGVWAGTFARIYDCTISDNVAAGQYGNTGGLLFSRGANVYNSTISGNQANVSAGLASKYQSSAGYLYIASSTISGNVASDVNGVGGVRSFDNMYMVGSTIANNRDGGGSLGAGLYVGASVYAPAYGVIIADNYSGTARSDIGGGPSARFGGHHNLTIASTLQLPSDTIFGDPRLGPLSDNGGPTLTHALLAGSPAIDAGDVRQQRYDQRLYGFTRIAGAAPDIGAYEVQSSGRTTMITNCDGAGPGSLPDAVANATSGDTIDLTQLNCSTITLSGGAMQATIGNLTLRGPGADRLTIDGDHASAVIDHQAQGRLSLSGVTLAHGYRQGDMAYGGCAFDVSTLELDDVVVTGCRASATGSASFGGGVSATRLLMNASTVNDNESDAASGNANGGGVSAGYLRMRGSTLVNNTALGSNATTSFGGGVFAGQSDISSSSIIGNQAGRGAGAGLIFGKVTNSTVSGNAAFLSVAGVYSLYLGLYNSTVTSNTAPASSAIAAGMFQSAYALRLQSSIIFGNTNGSSAYDIGLSDGVILGSHNLIGAAATVLPPDTLRSDPLLEPLADNGGPTLTHALQAGSPAIDAGNNVDNLDTDQRGEGFVRVFGASADIGAFELQTMDAIFGDGFD